MTPAIAHYLKETIESLDIPGIEKLRVVESLRGEGPRDDPAAWGYIAFRLPGSHGKPKLMVLATKKEADEFIEGVEAAA